jgi:hypothetical protein
MTDPDFLSLPPEHTILTPRLRLRTARLSDAEACKSFICDYETMKYSTTGAVAKNDLGAVENWMKARVLGSEVFQFVVTLRGGHDDDGDEGRKEEARGKTKEEVVIGMLGSHHAPEVGYLLDPGEFFLTSFFGCPWYHRVWERERDLYRIECKRSKPRNGFSLSHHSTYPTYLPPKSITTNSKCKKKVKILTPPPLFPAHAGKGYATEALRAFIPAFFAHMSSSSSSPSSNPPANPQTPSSSSSSPNYILAETDQDNLASQNVLLKCGFEFVERLTGAFDSPVLGVRDTMVYRLWRDGKKDKEEEEEGFVPPLQ